MIFSFFSLCRDLFFFKVGRAQTFERQQQRAERDGVEQAQKRRVSLAKKAFSVDNTLYQASIDIRTIVSPWIWIYQKHLIDTSYELLTLTDSQFWENECSWYVIYLLKNYWVKSNNYYLIFKYITDYFLLGCYSVWWPCCRWCGTGCCWQLWSTITSWLRRWSRAALLSSLGSHSTRNNLLNFWSWERERELR